MRWRKRGAMMMMDAVLWCSEALGFVSRWRRSVAVRKLAACATPKGTGA